MAAPPESNSTDAPVANSTDVPAAAVGEGSDNPEEASVEVEVQEEADELDPLEINLDCEAAAAFPVEVFDIQPDVTKVYLEPADLPESMFTRMGFEKVITVFGIPIISSKDISPEVFAHAGKIFAEYLDNDKDGILDNPDAVDRMLEYRAIIGYVNGSEESESLWKDRFRAPENEDFRAQFVCNMHFFEQWASDATPTFHNITSVASENLEDEESCAERSKVDFDWPLWYFPFTTAYYGYFEVFDDATVMRIQEAMSKAQEAGLFTGSYPNDRDMELSDFFVWSMITSLGALRCHCDSEVVLEAWKLCRADQVKLFNETWLEVIQDIPGLPRRLPDGKYQSVAIVAKSAE